MLYVQIKYYARGMLMFGDYRLKAKHSDKYLISLVVLLSLYQRYLFARSNP